MKKEFSNLHSLKSSGFGVKKPMLTLGSAKNNLSGKWPGCKGNDLHFPYIELLQVVPLEDGIAPVRQSNCFLCIEELIVPLLRFWENRFRCFF